MTTENRLLRAYGQGCARSTLLYAAIAIVVLGGFCCVSVAAALLPIDDEFRLWIWIGLIVLFMMTMFGGMIIWGIFTIRKRNKEMNEIFIPLGFEGRGYLMNGRQYHGTHRGYPMHVYFYRGPTVQIYLDVPLGTRVGIGRKSELARLAKNLIEREVLDLDDPAFDELAIYPDDPRWAAELFTDPQSRTTILRLINEDSAAELRSLSITPNALLWQSRYIPLRNINAKTAHTWIDDLYELARIAQGLTPPLITTVESALEQTTRTNRSKYTGPVIGITCAFFAVLAACLVMASIGLIFLMESGY